MATRRPSLLLVGIAFSGLFTASIASFFVESDAKQSSGRDLSDEIRELRAQIADLRRDLVVGKGQADG